MSSSFSDNEGTMSEYKFFWRDMVNLIVLGVRAWVGIGGIRF